MLVLSRKRNESLVINHDIVITIVDVRGEKVRMGVEAPSEVPVHRREVYDAIKRERGGVDAPIMLNLPPDVKAAVEKMASERGEDVQAMLSEWVTFSLKRYAG